MANKGNKPWKNSGSESNAPATTKKKFQTPIKGYEDVIFTLGAAKDAAQFMDMIEQL